MGRSLSNYSKLKTSEFENYNKNKKKTSSKKNRNLTKWGKKTKNDLDSSIDTFILNSPDGTIKGKENDASTNFRSWE
jgi:hypothetical protein